MSRDFNKARTMVHASKENRRVGVKNNGHPRSNNKEQSSVPPESQPIFAHRILSENKNDRHLPTALSSSIQQRNALDRKSVQKNANEQRSGGYQLNGKTLKSHVMQRQTAVNGRDKRSMQNDEEQFFNANIIKALPKIPRRPSNLSSPINGTNSGRRQNPSDQSTTPSAVPASPTRRNLGGQGPPAKRRKIAGNHPVITAELRNIFKQTLKPPLKLIENFTGSQSSSTKSKNGAPTKVEKKSKVSLLKVDDTKVTLFKINPVLQLSESESSSSDSENKTKAIKTISEKGTAKVESMEVDRAPLKAADKAKEETTKKSDNASTSSDSDSDTSSSSSSSFCSCSSCSYSCSGSSSSDSEDETSDTNNSTKSGSRSASENEAFKVKSPEKSEKNSFVRVTAEWETLSVSNLNVNYHSTKVRTIPLSELESDASSSNSSSGSENKTKATKTISEKGTAKVESMEVDRAPLKAADKAKEETTKKSDNTSTSSDSDSDTSSSSSSSFCSRSSCSYSCSGSSSSDSEDETPDTNNSTKSGFRSESENEASKVNSPEMSEKNTFVTVTAEWETLSVSNLNVNYHPTKVCTIPLLELESDASSSSSKDSDLESESDSEATSPTKMRALRRVFIGLKAF